MQPHLNAVDLLAMASMMEKVELAAMEEEGKESMLASVRAWREQMQAAAEQARAEAEPFYSAAYRVGLHNCDERAYRHFLKQETERR